jgi:hypothetical protein
MPPCIKFPHSVAKICIGEGHGRIAIDKFDRKIREL